MFSWVLRGDARKRLCRRASSVADGGKVDCGDGGGEDLSGADPGGGDPSGEDQAVGQGA